MAVQLERAEGACVSVSWGLVDVWLAAVLQLA